jgi:cytochrome c oxidase subunit III
MKDLEKYRDDTGSRLGMWLFLLSEIFLFGGLFILYTGYRYRHSFEFHLAAQELDRLLGTFNTVILLTSSLTMALSISKIQNGSRRSSLLYLGLTILLGVIFLGNKSIEWATKFEHGLFPNSPVLLGRTSSEILFFGLYYAMTGLHGLHVVAGIVVLCAMGVFIFKGTIHESHFTPLENCGLYWHLVDIIWIFLFPLFYLIT